jgi:type III pantothenate kinase
MSASHAKHRAAMAPALLIDAGNTRVKWALREAESDSEEFSASGAFEHAEAPSTWAALPRPRGAWISNVAGAELGARLDALLGTHWPDLPRTTISARAEQCGVINRYDTPGQLGSDRWAGLIGARAVFPGEALLLATLGTATTLEALSAAGHFAGGLIAPGWELMMRALGTHTAQLPTLTAETAAPLVAGGAPGMAAPAPFARNTPHAVSVGSLYAQAGLIERAWHELQSLWQQPVRLVLSGGNAEALAPLLRVPHTQHASLVLEGLAQIAAQDGTPIAQR